MEYEGIILELMSRIKKLESSYIELADRLTELEECCCPEGDGAGDQRPGEGEALDQGPGEGSEAASRQKMTPEMVQACYDCALSLEQNSNLDFRREINKLANRVNMNRNSAIMYVYCVKSMLNGEIYKRAINQTATEQYFKNILHSFGKDGLKKALAATHAHIAYRQECGHHVDGLTQLYLRYQAQL